MADTKISALPAVTTPAGTDEFAVNQGGTTKRQTRAQIHTLESGETLDTRAGATRLGTTLIGTAIPATGSPTVFVGTGIQYHQISLRGTDADETQRCGIGFGHGTAAEEPYAAISGFGDGATNIVLVGGGASGLNAAMILRFFTAANSTTLTGTLGFDFTGVGATSLLHARGGIEADGKIQTPASAAGSAGLNLPHGTAPTSPNDGDKWTDSDGSFERINGVTKQVAYI